MRWMILALALSTGCSWKKRVKHLDDQEFDHYYALRVFMDDAQKKTYLKKKTREERDAYLKEIGLWDRFYNYDEHIRDLIVAGQVQTGWTKDMLYMAWGAPYDINKLVGRKATRSERLTYRFEEHEDGSVLVWEPDSKTAYKATRLFLRDVILDDNVVMSIEEKSGTW